MNIRGTSSPVHIPEQSSIYGLCEMDEAIGRSTHTCNSCSRTFSRAEHLERHLSVHLPTTSSRSFICNYCTKGFTRKDVLTRHVRAVHETKRPEQRKSRRKSCNRCARFKIKCAGGSRGHESSPSLRDACEACKKRGLPCVYELSTQKADDSDESRSDGSITYTNSKDSGRSPPASPIEDIIGDMKRRCLDDRSFATSPLQLPTPPGRGRASTDAGFASHSIAPLGSSTGFTRNRSSTSPSSISCADTQLLRKHQHSLSFISLGESNHSAVGGTPRPHAPSMSRSLSISAFNEPVNIPDAPRSACRSDFGLSTPETSPTSYQPDYEHRGFYDHRGSLRSPVTSSLPENPQATKTLPLLPPAPVSPALNSHNDLRYYQNSSSRSAGTKSPTSITQVTDSRQCLTLPPLRQLLGIDNAMA
jgi:hypothetical protein